jgi:geranylgeranyl reductase family protein
MYDVIIVGAGAGGASAAYFLTQAGMSVLVIEKQTLPRYKACGGGVSLQMLAKYFPFSFEPIIETHPSSICWVMGNDNVTIPLPEGTLGMFMRAKFDAFILEHSGAEVITSSMVTNVIEKDDHVLAATKDGRTFEGRYLIGADGANSMVAKSLGLRRHLKPIPAIEAEVTVPDSVMARFAHKPVFIFAAIRRGYLWIFPKRDHLSVGIAHLKPGPGQLHSRLTKVMSEFGISLDRAIIHGHTIPLYSHPQSIAMHRCLLVGDAAGLVDPLSGEGIRLAIKSAWLASQAIVNNKLASYPAKVFTQIGLSQMLALPLRLVFYYLTELCFIFGVYNPFATQAFISLLADQLGYGRVILRLFGSLPLFFVTEISSGLLQLFRHPSRANKIRKRVYGIWAREEE